MSRLTIVVPDDLHPETAALVADFASAMAEKLKAAQDKHGYSDGWKHGGWRNTCANDLLRHVAKGDPVDVANYCAFMWYHKWPTSMRSTIHA